MFEKYDNWTKIGMCVNNFSRLELGLFDDYAIPEQFSSYFKMRTFPCRMSDRIGRITTSSACLPIFFFPSILRPADLSPSISSLGPQVCSCRGLPHPPPHPSICSTFLSSSNSNKLRKARAVKHENIRRGRQNPRRHTHAAPRRP